LAVNAQMLLQGKGGNLSERQAEFAQDILSCYQMIMQLTDWEKQYSKLPPPPAGSLPAPSK